jgi:hypothetical protein
MERQPDDQPKQDRTYRLKRRITAETMIQTVQMAIVISNNSIKLIKAPTCQSANQAPCHS